MVEGWCGAPFEQANFRASRADFRASDARTQHYFIGLLLVKIGQIFTIFGLFQQIKWVFGSKSLYLEFFTSDSWVETGFFRDETRREMLSKMRQIRE